MYLALIEWVSKIAFKRLSAFTLFLPLKRFIYTEEKWTWKQIFFLDRCGCLIINIRLDSLWTRPDAMSFSRSILFSYQYKLTFSMKES